jgi:hypothetical protein
MAYEMGPSTQIRTDLCVIVILIFFGVSKNTVEIFIWLYTVKRVDEAVRHPHLVTQDQFTQVSKKVSDIPEENFNINIDVFRQNFTNVELLRYKHISNVELLDDEHGTYPHFLQM